MTPLQITEELESIQIRLMKLFPESRTIGIDITEGLLSVRVHRLDDYEAATKLMRRLEIGERKKQSHEPNSPWGVLIGDLCGQISINAFHSGLAPSCKVKQVTRSIPKRETVDTGETIEVKELQIVCG